MKTSCSWIQILATRSYDEYDSGPFYISDVLEDDIGELSIQEETYTEPAEDVPQLRENFAEIWIWQLSNTR